MIACSLGSYSNKVQKDKKSHTCSAMRSKNFALSSAERSRLSKKCSSGITGLTSGGKSPLGAAADPPDGAIAGVPSAPTVTGVVPAPEATGVAESAGRSGAMPESVERTSTTATLAEEAAGTRAVLQATYL